MSRRRDSVITSDFETDFLEDFGHLFKDPIEMGRAPIGTEVHVSSTGETLRINSAKTDGVTPGYYWQDTEMPGRVGMIKKPKHGATDQVFGEALVMRLVRDFSSQTRQPIEVANCDVRLMRHEGTLHPILFSTFSEMTPLSDYIAGNNHKANEAGFRPVSEGLTATSVVGGFGVLSVLAPIFKDRDLFGKEAQNKGYIFRGNQAVPFIFDWVLQGKKTGFEKFARLSYAKNSSAEGISDFWKVDMSNLTVQGTVDRKKKTYFDAHRHFAVRNSTLMNDDTYANRVDGIIAFHKSASVMQNRIRAYMGFVAQKLDSSEISPEFASVLNDLQAFLRSSLEMLEARTVEMQEIHTHMLDFYHRAGDNPHAVSAFYNLKTLLSRKVSFYSSEGIPLRVPHLRASTADSLHFPLRMRDAVVNDGMVHFRVPRRVKFPERLVGDLRAQGIDAAVSENGDVLSIPVNQLANLNERCVRAIRFPESLPLKAGHRSYLYSFANSYKRFFASSDAFQKLFAAYEGHEANKTKKLMLRLVVLNQMNLIVNINVLNLVGKDDQDYMDFNMRLKHVIVKEKQLLLLTAIRDDLLPHATAAIKEQLATDVDAEAFFQVAFELDIQESVNELLSSLVYCLPYEGMQASIDEIVEAMQQDISQMGDAERRAHAASIKQMIRNHCVKSASYGLTSVEEYRGRLISKLGACAASPANTALMSRIRSNQCASAIQMKMWLVLAVKLNPKSASIAAIHDEFQDNIQGLRMSPQMPDAVTRDEASLNRFLDWVDENAISDSLPTDEFLRMLQGEGPAVTFAAGAMAVEAREEFMRDVNDDLRAADDAIATARGALEGPSLGAVASASGAPSASAAVASSASGADGATNSRLEARDEDASESARTEIDGQKFI